MNSKKAKPKPKDFPDVLLKSWEDGDGVNFAAALARVTGWLLHVDWWTPGNDQHAKESEMKSLRVYVGDDADNIYDVKGKFRIASFSNQIVLPIAKKIGNGKGNVVTRYYSEEKLFLMPLRVKPDKGRIAAAEQAILNAPEFLEKVRPRKAPFIPAYLAATFTFGKCAVYAEALSAVTGSPATAFIVTSYTEIFGHSRTGYAHSIVLHPDGSGEDAWGRRSIEEIAARYGMESYYLSQSEHAAVVKHQKNTSPDKFERLYKEAHALVSSIYSGI